MNTEPTTPMPSHHLPSRTLACLCLCAALCGQTETAKPGPEPTFAADVGALAKRVDAAHRPEGPVEPVTQFRAALEVHIDAADAQQGGQVDLDVRYMQYVNPDPRRNRTRHLIRYVVQRAGRPIERGRDEFGFWHLVQGKATDLTQADVEDRKACVRDTNLARQLVRFLDPGAVLRSLADTTAVVEEQLRLGREAGVDCETVEGTLKSFPLLQLGGDDAAARVKIYVTKDGGRLLALLVRPIIDGAVDEAGAELIRLSDMFREGGMLVPKRIEHLFKDAEGRLRKQSKVLITTLDLRPEFAKQDLARPKR